MIDRLRHGLDVAVFLALRLVHRGFGEGVPVIDAGLMAVAAWWCVLLVVHPVTFTTGAFAGEFLFADRHWAWPLLMSMGLTVGGLARPRRVALRLAGLLSFGWGWMVVAITLARVTPSTGTGAYLIFAVLAFGNAINVHALHQERRLLDPAAPRRGAATPAAAPPTGA